MRAVSLQAEPPAGLRWRELAWADGRRCRVAVGRGAAAALEAVWRPGWERAALVGDATVLERFGPRVTARLAGLASAPIRIAFAPGEASKNRRQLARIQDALLDAGAGRGTCVVGLGGGVSLDLAGFTAATHLRGVDWIALPSSLLAQVDAAVGGKTGVNTRHGKNLVGAFHQPAAVLIDPDWPASLPPTEWANGLVELVKHAWIADAALFARLEAAAAALARPQPLEPELLLRGLQVKLDCVAADEREAGRRAWLNAGHSVGHALERASGYRLAHGRAVAAGLWLEARLAVRGCGLDPAAPARLERLWQVLELEPVDWPPLAAVLGHLDRDKKNRAGRVHMALPRAVGAMAGGSGGWTLPVTAAELEAVWPV